MKTIAHRFALLVILLIPTIAMGQQIFGSIYGTVTDGTGAAVPNAKLTITDQEKGTKFETTTNEAGNYTKDRLIPGSYTVEVEGNGFRKAVSKDVVVRVDQGSRLDVTLQVGDVTQEVEVTASAPLLQSDRADVATTFNAKQLETLPSLERNAQSFLLLTPGAVKLNGWDHAASENPQGSKQIFVNGQHFSGTGYQLDGTENQSPILGIIVINPNLDSLQESKISSQNYDAEFGYAGAGIMNLSTKSGTNDIHGTAFEYLRTNTSGFTDFGRDPFSEPNGAAAVHWNQFGGSVGGPLVKNKIFWFGDAQLTRQRTGSTVLTNVPTVKARTGDLSEYVFGTRNVVYDPLSGNPATGQGREPFGGNLIPSNRLSQQALNILKLVPLPNAVDPGGTAYRNNYIGGGSNAFNANNWDTRWDWFATTKQTVFGRYSYQEFDQLAPAAFGVAAGGPSLAGNRFSGTATARNQSLALGYTRVISATMVNDFRFGFMRYRVNTLPGDVGTSPAKDAGIPGLNLDPFFTSGIPYFHIQGDGETKIGYSLDANGCNCPLAEREQQFQWADNLSKIIGNHTLKFGADLRWAWNLRVPSDTHRSGEMQFENGYTGNVPAGGGDPQSGLGLASFLLGEVTNFGRYVSVSTDAQERQKRFFWYGQDAWRITSKLQVNYGVRWEMVFPETVNVPGNGAQLNLATGKIGVFGIGNIPIHGYQDMNWHNFAPRLGVTYQLTQKTVVRAGYGWAYELGTFGSIFGHNVTQNLPVLAIQSVNRPASFQGVFTLAQGPPAAVFPQPDSNGEFPLPQGIRGKARPQTLIMPRVMTFNFTVQHQLTNDLSLTVGYVGNQGRHMFTGNGPTVDPNVPAYIPGTTLSQDARRPFFSRFGWTQGIDLYCNCANNRYDSLQIDLEKRYSHGLTFHSSYTYQVSQLDGATSGDGNWAFIYNRPLGYGTNGYFPHHQFTFAPTWEIPFGKGRKFGNSVHRGVDLALGGWNLDAVTVVYSGFEFDPTYDAPPGFSRPDVGPNNIPNQGSSDPYAGARQDRSQWFAGGLGGAFVLPAPNTFGTYPISSLKGPKYYGQDMALAKNFKFTERFIMTLRAEAYNIWNHTNLGMPANNVTASNTGQITGIAFGSNMRR
ncbi:MAG TPA: carboxypeptidase regulatory-like domain-containing protein, partial [Bryobacteraceae bacterium]